MARFLDRIRDFSRDDSGAITALILVLFLGIVMATGIAIDLMRFEARRADLQDSLDRGVLAATSLRSTIDPTLVVNDYMKTRQFDDTPVTPTVNATPEGSGQLLNSRRVSATADSALESFFLKILNQTQLGVSVGSAAEERRMDVEISLVLDISGSMARENSSVTVDDQFGNPVTQSRLQVLRNSASNFVDLILTDDTRATTSISLVPFAGQTALNATMFDYFRQSQAHGYSRCVDFNGNDFLTAALPAANARPQTPHFQWFRFEADYGHEAEWGWCPSNDRAVIPYSNDNDLLKTAIQGFMGHDGTGTQNAMKWGLGLLDPSTQPLIETMAIAGDVPDAFRFRPRAYDDPDVLKVIVLMTDGNIRYQQRPVASAYDTAAEREYLASHGLTSLSSSNWTLRYSSNRTADEDLSVQQFYQLCTLAKQNGVVVFTIGFDIADGADALTEMQTCASTPSHFHRVEGIELTTAFTLIASSIQQLKLVE